MRTTPMKVSPNETVLPFLKAEQILQNGSSYYSALTRDIAQAKQSIDFETYIFDFDAVGERIAAALIAAAKGGVKVRVLVDGVGTPHWSSTFARRMEEVGIDTKIFHPFPWHIWNWSRSVVRLTNVMKWLYLFFKVNSRNHRKVCIIDCSIAYVGSLNITKNHLP